MREAELEQHTLLRLPERIERRPLPIVRLVDLRRMTTGARILSHPLRVAISERLAAQQQTILFLNRRGYSHTLLCQNAKCGHGEECPNCSVPLTYHKQAGLLRCHHCDYQQQTKLVCPKCGGAQLPFKGVGTERLEMEVQALWPQARLGRLDRDTTDAQRRPPCHPRPLRARGDGYPHRHADGRQGVRLSPKSRWWG